MTTLADRSRAPQTSARDTVSLHDAARRARDRAVAALLSLQKPDGHWCGELEGDSILESEYILMKWILRQEDDPRLPKILEYLRRLQRPDGGWGQFPGSGIDVSATVKAYVCLLLDGDPIEAEHMRCAERAILDHGGAEQCNTFSSFYLAALGLISWDAVPTIPPEMIWLPRWSYFHLDKVSAWTRTMVLPLAICTALRPVRRLDREHGLPARVRYKSSVTSASMGSSESADPSMHAADRFASHGLEAHAPRVSIDHLFRDRRYKHILSKRFDRNPFTWRNFFLGVDRVLKILQRADAMPMRRQALRDAEQWILQRVDPQHTEGLGAIFPPMVYLQIAFHALGYPRSHPVIQQAERDLDAFMIENEETIRLQPCFSPVWDTGIALYALTDCVAGVRGQGSGARGQGQALQCLDFTPSPSCSIDDAISRACDWLRAKENTLAGDWSRTVNAEPAGWYFEYRNDWYPDVDDTAMVAMALYRSGGAANLAAGRRGVKWILAMQNDDGGWAAFDKTRDRPILEQVPFADHNAMQDPSCPDITGRVLECLAWHGYTIEHPAVKRAVEFIRRRQEPEGGWFGRWGVNYIYGTWQAVGGLRRIGADMSQEWIQRAGRWLKSIQKDDGSFGESANSYEDPSLKGVGPSTASQTAWAAMTLQTIYGPDDPDLARAIRWLCETQLNEQDAADPKRNPDGDPSGSWCETEFTGTGFPRVFYLRYHLYRLYFPLMALARYTKQGSGVGGRGSGEDGPISPAREKD